MMRTVVVAGVAASLALCSCGGSGHPNVSAADVTLALDHAAIVRYCLDLMNGPTPSQEQQGRHAVSELIATAQRHPSASADGMSARQILVADEVRLEGCGEPILASEFHQALVEAPFAR